MFILFEVQEIFINPSLFLRIFCNRIRDFLTPVEGWQFNENFLYGIHNLDSLNICIQAMG